MDDKLPINRHTMKSQEFKNDMEKDKSEKTINDFATAFPNWDLTPPAIVVKRVRRGI